MSLFSRLGVGGRNDQFRQFQESLLAYRRRPATVLGAWGLALAIHTLTVAIYLLVASALSIPVSILVLALVVPFVILAAQIPLSLGGWGIREGATILLLESFGVRPVEALSLSLLCVALTLFSGAAGGALFLLRDPLTRTTASPIL